jgi:CPA2 family monovalent cation:H+ antiporter-2
MHVAPLIQDLAVILGVAAVVTYIFKVIKQPVVLGYVAAGIIVGPYTPPVFSVVDVESVKVWSELGVIFLMFALGLEFSFRKLLKLGPSAAFTGIFQIIIMVLAGYYLAKVFGWSRFDAVFLGCMISISSTTIIIKAFEELNLKSRKFAELSFGILIVEDLAAILMLVALTNFVTKDEIEASAILMSTGKLLLVVSTWLILGLFLVPRIVKRVAKRGNDEMLTIAALSLCLGFVTLAAYFEYSVALGAFIMGSILAETGTVKRIETLITPLRDVFGAVFFVSVGMLLDPAIIFNNFSHVFLVSLVIIIGKILSVSLGALITGQTLRTSINTGFSMAQIGEFSFIIAALGQTLGVIDKELYPVIVAASLVTTFTTPYLIRFSLPLADRIERKLPTRVATLLERYRMWFQARSATSAEKKQTVQQFIKFATNAAITIVLFAVAAKHLPHWFGRFILREEYASLASWLVAMIVTAPLLWAMLNAFREGNTLRLVFLRNQRLEFNLKIAISWIATLVFIAVLSAEFFSGWISLMIFIATFLIVVLIFGRRVGEVATRLEKHFIEGISDDHAQQQSLTVSAQKLVPWEAHLASVKVPVDSPELGKTLLELQLRERYGINVIAINRDHLQVVAPGATERVYPHDVLLCFASDKEIEQFRTDISRKDAPSKSLDAGNFLLRQLKIPSTSRMAGKSIKDSGVYTKYHCVVVGIERQTQRIKSPKSDQFIQAHDILWLIGSIENLQKLIDDVARTNDSVI